MEVIWNGYSFKRVEVEISSPTNKLSGWSVSLEIPYYAGDSDIINHLAKSESSDITILHYNAVYICHGDVTGHQKNIFFGGVNHSIRFNCVNVNMIAS